MAPRARFVSLSPWKETEKFGLLHNQVSERTSEKQNGEKRYRYSSICAIVAMPKKENVKGMKSHKLKVISPSLNWSAKS
jgi:hypothetical protein